MLVPTGTTALFVVGGDAIDFLMATIRKAMIQIERKIREKREEEERKRDRAGVSYRREEVGRH